MRRKEISRGKTFVSIYFFPVTEEVEVAGDDTKMWQVPEESFPESSWGGLKWSLVELALQPNFVPPLSLLSFPKVVNPKGTP